MNPTKSTDFTPTSKWLFPKAKQLDLQRVQAFYYISRWPADGEQIVFKQQSMSDEQAIKKAWKLIEVAMYYNSFTFSSDIT